ncbi:tRNA-ribosyltransferase, partial [Halorubrum ezzemoulense]
RGHTVSMTSPIGVVPQELETTYPAQHYDSVVTGDWSEDEIGFVAEVLRRYLERNDYSRVIAHVPEDGYREICERVEGDPAVDVDFEYTCVDHPTTDESLGELNAALQGEPAYSKREREHNTVRAIADYLLGDCAGDDLFGGRGAGGGDGVDIERYGGEADVRTTGRYPKLQVWADDPDAGREGEPGEQLATMVPQYGTLSFTLAGARRWVESDAPTK